MAVCAPLSYSYQVRILCDWMSFFIFFCFVEGVHFVGRRWHHVRLGPEDARDWARPEAAKHPLAAVWFF